MNKQMNISVAFNLDLHKILNELVQNESYMAQLGNITIKYIGTTEDTVKGKREIFERKEGLKMLVGFALYKKDKLLFVARYWEDLQEFVEELKKLNKQWIDRRDFSIRSGNEIIYSWNRK